MKTVSGHRSLRFTDLIQIILDNFCLRIMDRERKEMEASVKFQTASVHPILMIFPKRWPATLMNWSTGKWINWKLDTSSFKSVWFFDIFSIRLSARTTFIVFVFFPFDATDGFCICYYFNKWQLRSLWIFFPLFLCFFLKLPSSLSPHLVYSDKKWFWNFINLLWSLLEPYFIKYNESIEVIFPFWIFF